MKKIFLSIAMLFLLTSCSSKEENISTETPITKETVFYVVRHGKTILNEADRVQGWADSPLIDEGALITEQLASGFLKENINFDFAYSSDSGRAQQTANIILEKMNQKSLELTTKNGFREVNFGTYEGEKYPVMMQDVSNSLGFNNLKEFKQSETYNLKTRTDAMQALDQTGYAETFDELQKRMQENLKTTAEEVTENGGGNVLLVSHGMAIIAMLTDMTDDNIPEHLANASVSKIIYKDNQFVVESINDTHYLN